MNRPLTERERATLVAMITHAAEFSGEQDVTPQDRKSWLNQVPTLRAGEKCTCGTCPSIPLLSVPRARSHDDELRERVVLGSSLKNALVLLFIDDGVPSYLELAPTIDGIIYTEFPAAENLMHH